MKKFLLILILSFTTLLSNAQEKMLDYFGQSITYCKQNLSSYEEIDSDEYVLIKTSIQKTLVFYAINKKTKLVEAVFLPFSTKKQMKILIKAFNEISPQISKNVWVMKTEKHNIEVTCVLLKKDKMFIFK